MAWKTRFDRRALKELKYIDTRYLEPILRAICDIQQNPLGKGEPLKGKFLNKRKIRVGDYRVLYSLDEQEKIVWIDAIGHRKDIYE